MARKKKKRYNKGGFFIDSLNAWVGSWVFLLLHIVWFGVWLVYKLDLEILIMIVSLEAIILMVLLLMAANRKSTKDDLRADQDLDADLAALKGQEKMMRQLQEIKRELRKLKNK